MLVLGAALVRASAAPAGNAGRPPPGEVRRALEAVAGVVDEEIGAGRIPGAVVLVGHDGEIVYRRAFGARQTVPERQPMTDDTIFDLASLTKVVATTTAVMQLVERGDLHLDAPVARYWPAFGGNGKRRITVEELLTHRSGLRADIDLRSSWSGYREALTRIAAERPLRPPGSGFLYSDINFEVLGELVRRVSGQPLDVYCRARVFEPLGMRDTGFRPAARSAGIAPTTYVGGRLRRGEVHDPTAQRMGGVAGHAGLFSTAGDLAVFAQMLLDGGAARGAQILKPATVRRMTRPQGSAAPPRRGLGWEIGSRLGSASYGHTGYTGTSLWIDPATRSFVVLLTNRVHPDDRGDARPIRQRVAALASEAFTSGLARSFAADGRSAVESGVDVLVSERFARLAGSRVGLITNESGVDSTGRRTIELLESAPGVQLVALFSPEHGLGADREGEVGSGREPSTGLPVHSLYGAVKRPTTAMLRGVDVLVFDVQDAGVRFYTYVTTMAYAMEAAAEHGLPFYVLDRPDPISAAVVQGPVLDRDLRSFTGYYPLPVRYGMTIGELARFLNAENAIGADLRVIEMRGYRRAQWHDETGLRWVRPSPNLRSVDQAALYPGVALVEGANVSVGRGTDAPFEVVGAPWIDGAALASYLNGRSVAGVRFEPFDFTPAEQPFRAALCHGVRLRLLDRQRLDAPALGVEIASALRRLYGGVFDLGATLGMIGDRATLEAIGRGEDPRSIVRRWQGPLEQFSALRAKYLIY